MLALEPRYVFDAAVASELHDLLHPGVVDGSRSVHSSRHDTGAGIVAAAQSSNRMEVARQQVSRSYRPASETLVAAHNLAPSNREIAFIDSRLADLGALVCAVPEGTRIVLIEVRATASRRWSMR